MDVKTLHEILSKHIADGNGDTKVFLAVYREDERDIICGYAREAFVNATGNITVEALDKVR